LIEHVLRAARRLDIEHFDLRTSTVWGNSLEFKETNLEKAYGGSESGASIRVLYKGTWGFYATNETTPAGLKRCLDRAFKLAKGISAHAKEKAGVATVKGRAGKGKIPQKVELTGVDITKKKELALDVAKAILSVKGIPSCKTNYTDGIATNQIYDIDGNLKEGTVPRAMVSSQITARDGANVVSFRTRVGATGGFEIFTNEDPVEKAVTGAKSTLRLLKAGKAPSGRLPLVADPSLAGVFAHEAVGHACESDLVLMDESVLKGKIGKKIASDIVTIIDDSTVPGGFGSFVYDDEGVPAQKRVLIERGILRTYMMTRETAHKLKKSPNGSGRAESVGSKPMVRMSNTLIEPGDREYDEMFEGIKLGIFALGTRGGQVDTTKGAYQFNAQEAFLIEKGEVTKPLKDVSISGSILETMNKIDALGKVRMLGEPGFCGKGQTVPVGDGGPYVRVKEIVMGGG